MGAIEAAPWLHRMVVVTTCRLAVVCARAGHCWRERVVTDEEGWWPRKEVVVLFKHVRATFHVPSDAGRAESA